MLGATSVDAKLDLSKEENQLCLYVLVEGFPRLIAEVGEVLAWMGSALKSSPYNDRVAYVRPFVQNQIGTTPFSCDYGCTIGFSTRQKESDQTSRNGQCWHNLFRNVLIVEGYPIARRPAANLGLEIPLTMMARLAQTDRVEVFAEKLFIKGFSTMLVPTEYNDNITMWHFLSAKDNERISYNDGFELCKADIHMFQLGTSRHILGWCPEMKFYAGSNESLISFHSQCTDEDRCPRWNLQHKTFETPNGPWEFSFRKRIHLQGTGIGRRGTIQYGQERYRNQYQP